MDQESTSRPSVNWPDCSGVLTVLTVLDIDDSHAASMAMHAQGELGM